MTHVKAALNKRLLNIIENDEQRKNDQIEDHSKISALIETKLLLNALLMVIITFTLTYFIAMFWLMFCHLNLEFRWMYFEDEEYFIDYFPHFNSGTDRWLVALYYSFTSLSTIGLGDFNPRSDSERLVCSFLLLFGVAVFSYIIGTLIEIIDTFNNFNTEPGDEEAV